MRVKKVYEARTSKQSANIKLPIKILKSISIVLNKALFKNLLTTISMIFKLKRFDNDETKKFCYGQVIQPGNGKGKGTAAISWLQMLPSYRNKKEFVETLGTRNDTSIWQMNHKGDTGNHNKLFYSFRPKVK